MRASSISLGAMDPQHRDGGSNSRRGVQEYDVDMYGRQRERASRGGDEEGGAERPHAGGRDSRDRDRDRDSRDRDRDRDSRDRGRRRRDSRDRDRDRDRDSRDRDRDSRDRGRRRRDSRDRDRDRDSRDRDHRSSRDHNSNNFAHYDDNWRGAGGASAPLSTSFYGPNDAKSLPPRSSGESAKEWRERIR